MREVRQFHDAPGLAVEVVAEPPFSRACRTAAWAEQTSFWDTPGFLLRLLFFALAPFVFVIVCMMLNQTLLLVLMLITVLLTGVLGNPTGWLERYPSLERVALVGESLKLLKRVRECYLENRPRSFLFYVFYPLACPLLLPFSAGVRKEFRLYAGLLGAIALALLLEVAFSYQGVYPPHLGFKEAFVIIFVQLFFSLAAIIGFVIPVTTTSFTYHLSGRQGRLRCLALLALLSALVSVLAHLNQQHPPLSLQSSELLSGRMQKASFRAELREATEMFLLYHAPQLPEQGEHAPLLHADLTEKYRRHIAGLAIGSEASAFSVFTVRTDGRQADRPWLGVKVRYFDSRHQPPRVLALVSPQGRSYTSWAKLPPNLQHSFPRIDRPGGPSWQPPLEQVGVAALIDDLP